MNVKMHTHTHTHVKSGDEALFDMADILSEKLISKLCSIVGN